MKKIRKNISHTLGGSYHWIVAAVMFLMLFVHGGSTNNFLTLHLVPISEHLSISRATFSLIFSLKSIVAMLSTFFSGYVISRLGCRRTAVLGMFMAGLAYVLFANVESLAILAAGSVLLGLSYGFCTTAIAVAVVRFWFHRHEGTVLGIVTAATGVGGSVLSILQTGAMESGSFRSSLYLCAGLVFGTMILVALLARNRPEDMGLKPLGEGERRKKRPKAETFRFPGLRMSALWKKPAFYGMLFNTFLSSFFLYLAYNVTRNFFVDCGFSVAQATGLHSAMMLLLTGTKLLSGVLCDKLGARKVNMICIACGGVGSLLLFLTRDFSVAALAVVVYTMALPLLTLIGPLLATELFGYRAQMQYTGMLVAAVSLGNLTGSYLTNLIYDTCRSYRPSFLLAAVLSALAILLYWLLYRQADRLKVNIPEE